MSLDDPSPLGRGRREPEADVAAALAEGGGVPCWPIAPDPGVTNLPGLQSWHFAGGIPVAAEVGGIRLAADDARIAHLGIRRDTAGRPYPAAFAHAPGTGEPLDPPGPAPDPDVLDVDGGAVEIPLTSGVPALVRAGRPAALYLFHENLGAFEAWDGRGFSALGRLPPIAPSADGEPACALAAGAHGIAYAAGDALVTVPLPQLGACLARTTTQAPGLRILSTPCWRGADLLVLAERDGRLVLCRRTVGAEAPAVLDLGPSASGRRFAGPWTNRLGDAFWTGAAGFVACRAGSEAAFLPWPDGFAPLACQAPWRDRADMHHQPGMAQGRYQVAALSGTPALRRLDGPHLAAGGVTYCGGERFDVPWEAPAEALNLGAHTGSLLVPLLAMVRDTVLLALDIPGPRAGFFRGGRLGSPVIGHVLHHAHGVGLRRLPVSLSVAGMQDAGALLHERVLYLWSRSEGRCHALRLRAA